MCLAKLAPSLKLIAVDVCWFEVVQITFFGKHNKVAAAVVCKKKNFIWTDIRLCHQLGRQCVWAHFVLRYPCSGNALSYSANIL